MTARHQTLSQQPQHTKATRYTAIAFAVLALTLLIISAYSYFGAREVQKNYNTMVSDSMHKLELINSLHNNEDLIYNAAIKHLNTTDQATMATLEQEIRQVNAEVMHNLRKLQALIASPERKNILQNYTNKRKDYTAELTRLLELSRQNKINDSIFIEAQKLLPAHHEHQLYLNKLGDSISVNTRAHGVGVLKTIDKTVRNYNLLLLAALLITGVTAVLVRRVINQIQQNAFILNSEIKERQQLKEAYSESQLIYRSLFRNISIPMWIFDQATMRIMDVNPAAIQEYGYTREEFMNLSILDLQPKEQVEELKVLISNLKGSLSDYPNWRHVRKDGSQFYVDIKSHGLPAQGTMFPRIVVAINIDERVEAIRRLERREKQLLEISSSLPGAVYQFELDKDMHFSFPFISEGIRDLFQVSPEEVIADSNVLFSTVHPDDIKPLWDSILHSYNTMEPWVNEFRAWQKFNSKYIWLRGHSLPSRKVNGVTTWNGTLIDITTQKEAQEKLIASEANLRYLLNSSPQAIYLLDSQLNIISFNAKAAEEVSSLQLKALQTGESILSFVAANQVNTTIESHKKALQGETTVFETCNSGIWHEVAFRPVFGHENQVLAVALSIQDITEQKLTLESIKHSEMQLTRAQELSQMGSWEYDIPAGIINWSDNLYKIYGVSKEEFSPRVSTIIQLVHPDDREYVLESYKKAHETGEPVHIEHRVITPLGEQREVVQIGEIFFDDNGNAVKMSGTIQDITERKKAEQDVTQAKNLLQSTLENIPEIIFSTDQYFNVTYISPQCLDILGYTDQELTGNSDLWTKNIYPDDIPLMEKMVHRLYNGEKFQYEIRVIDRAKQLKWLLLRLSPSLNNEGVFIRLDGSAADITQHKIAEAKREELNNQLINQNRNLQQFAYIVSHNLRAPIANILGLTSIYDKNKPDSPINQRVIDNMFKSARLLDSTIRDLNELLTMRSEMQDVKEEVYFSDVLKHVSGSLSDELQEADATLESDFEAAPSIITVKSYLQSIMVNLVSNAIKYRDHNRKLNIILKTFVADEYICLQVTDNGLGIDIKKEKDKVFGLYKRFHPTIAGKGLGLHLVKTQAELLGGKVEVESSVGVGTTFSVYFLKSSVVNEHIKESNFD